MSAFCDDDFDPIFYAKTMPKFYATEHNGDQAIAQYKFISVTSGWAWYCLEFYPATRTFFGLVNGFEMELGYFSLDEMAGVPGIIRDRKFQPTPIGIIKSQLHARNA